MDEMTIKLKTTNGFNLSIPIDDKGKYKIDTMIGNDNKMTIKVKYK